MRVESEKALERLLKKRVENDMGGWCLKLLSAHINGLPDRICLLPGGRVFFAEIKTTKKKPTALQRIIHRKLETMGFAVYVIDTSAQIQNIIKSYE